MGIDLCRGNVCVAQEFLHHAKIGAAFEQVRGERVPKRVRRDLFSQARNACVFADDSPDIGAFQRAAGA